VEETQNSSDGHEEDHGDGHGEPISSEVFGGDCGSPIPGLDFLDAGGPVIRFGGGNLGSQVGRSLLPGHVESRLALMVSLVSPDPSSEV